jgi:dephospho-CoA kinase
VVGRIAMNELRLCLIGQLRSGKDTLAAYAEEKYNMISFAFGDELKEEFHRNYPFVPKDPKPRKGYQLFGQLKRYVYGEDIWLDKCFSNIRTHKALSEQYREYHPTVPPFIPIITDARQPNEFARCQEEGFISIKVVSRFDTRLQRAIDSGDKFNVEDFYHETETYIENADADFIIINEGTLEELYYYFDIVMEKCRERL